MACESYDKLRTTKNIVISDHRKDVLHQLNDYRRSKHLCDVCVVAHGREFPAHRAMLAAGGGFFSGLFAANMREQSENKIQLHQEVDLDIVDDILSYIYTGEIELTRDNAHLIVIAADFLLLDKLKTPVDEFLAEVVQDISTDYLSTHQFAVQYKCELLEEAVLRLIRENFEAVVTGSREFLDLSLETLQEIIASDNLVVSCEGVVFRAVVDWVKHKEERKGSFYQLFSNIRLCSFSEDLIQSSIMAETLVTSDPSCVNLVLKSLKYTPTILDSQHPRMCLDPYTNAILVFPIQEEQDRTVRGPWCFAPSHDKWYHLTAPYHHDENYGYGTPIYFNGSVYCVGKVSSTSLFIDRFELEANAWMQAAGRMQFGESFSSVCLNGTIYIIGGETKSETGEKKSVADVYACSLPVKSQTRQETVKPIQSLIKSRTSPCVGTDGRYVYALGGYCHQDNCYTNTIERFDPECQSWTYLTPMKSDSCMAGQCCVSSGKIFVINGVPRDYDEVYDIKSDSWSEIPTPPFMIETGVLSSCNGKLYLIGSSNPEDESDVSGVNNILTMTYDTKKCAWAVIWSTTLKQASGLTRTPTYKTLAVRGTVARLLKKEVNGLQLLEEVEPEPIWELH